MDRDYRLMYAAFFLLAVAVASVALGEDAAHPASSADWVKVWLQAATLGIMVVGGLLTLAKLGIWAGQFVHASDAIQKAMEKVEQTLEDGFRRNDEDHDRICAAMDKKFEDHDSRIRDHDKRITLVEWRLPPGSPAEKQK